jgi:DNA-binding response OmpR family regulator
MEELLARVDVLGRRNVAAETEIVYRVGDLCMDTGKRRVNRGNKRIDLSPREFEVLQVFLREPGRTFSRDEICERIWEREHEYDTRTVEIFIMRLRKKIDRPGEESLIRTVRSVGYMVKAPCNPLFPALRSSHELSQRPSPQKQIPSSHFPLMRSGQAGGLIADMAK